MSLTAGQLTQAIGPNQIQSITNAAAASQLSGLVTPAAHATTHKSGGSDAIKLDELAAPTDVTTLNVSTSAHGLCPKAPNSTAQVLRGDGTFGTPVVFTGDSGAGGAVGAVPAPAAGDAAAGKFIAADGTWKVPTGNVPSSRAINTTAPLTGGGDLSADRTLAISDATAITRGAVPTPPNDATKFLRGDATWAVPSGTVTSVTGTAPIASSGGATPAISIGAFGPTQLQVTGSTSQTFTASGTWTCPAGVSAIQVECWGGGGGGGGGQNLGGGLGGGGGGGGAYSKSTAVSVSPGTTYTVNVGAAGTAGGVGTDGGAGGDSWFGSTATILAKGGGQGISGATTGAAGSGGASGSGVGGTKFSGGNGAAHGASSTGGGGGGSAGTGSIGNNASGTSGGAAVTGGGAGSNAGTPPSAASAPGGGGGAGSATFVGAAGGAGQVILTFSADTLTLTTVGGGGTPTLTFPPVTGNVITDQDVRTIPGQSLAASALALILMRVCRGA